MESGDPMRLIALLALTCCTPAPTRAPPVQVPVRLAEARHAFQVDQDIFVWPAHAPEGEPTASECGWWSDRVGARKTAVAGLNDGTLQWGAIHITRTHLGFAGKDVVPLDQGRLPAEAVDGPVIPALYKTVLQARRTLDAWYEACGDVRRDRPVLIADADVPQQTIVATLGTLAAARFPRVAARVGDRDPKNEVRKPGNTGVLAVVRQDGDTIEVMDSTGLLRLSGPTAQSESFLAKATGEAGLGCTLVLPTETASWAQVVSIIDTTTGFGSATSLVGAQAFLQPSNAWEPGPPAPPLQGRAPTEWLSLDNTMAVHWLELPDVLPITEDVPTAIPCADPSAAVRQKIQASDTLRLAMHRTPEPVLLPCTSISCSSALLLDPADDVPIVTVGWTGFGPVNLGSSSDPTPEMQTFIDGISACEVPNEGKQGAMRRAVAWLEIAPDGTVAERHVQMRNPADAPWAQCVLDSLTAFPTQPAMPPGQYAAVEVRIDRASPVR